LQKGEVIAVQNVYKCYPDRPCAHRRRSGTTAQADAADFGEGGCQAHPERVLCNISEDLENLKEDKTYKKSYIWNEPIVPSIYNRKVVFFGYDPEIDVEIAKARPFAKVKMQPLDIAILYFNLSGMVRGTRLNAGGEGHIDIHIHSNLLPKQLLKSGHSLPMFLQRKVNSAAYYQLEIKIMAMAEMEFSVQLDLRHGGHVESLFSLNECLEIKRWSPKITEAGTRNVFAAIVSRDKLLNGNYELPYNMPPMAAGHPGEEGLIVDMASTAGRMNSPQTVDIDGDNGLLKLQQTGKAYWNAEGINVAVMPWVPFLSNCEIFDSHIILWDLFEMPDGVRPGCNRYEAEDVLIVPPLGMDFETLELRMEPTADNCSFYVKCQFEESMRETDNTYEIWREIPEAEMTLFYLTRNPTPFEEINQGDGFFGPMEGGDNLIKVQFNADSRTARIPRRVVFWIQYYQNSPETKLVVKAGLDLTEFDEDEENTKYDLKIWFRAMVWDELMNAFELPLWVYTVLYIVVGMGAVAFTLIAWVCIRLSIKKTATMPFRLFECYDFMLNWPLQGVIIASIPIGVLCAVIKISFQPFADVTKSIPCTYEAFSIGQLDENEQDRCRNGRTGTCFLIGGLLMLVSGAKLLVPQLREEEEQFLLQQPTTGLNKEGIALPAEKRQLIRELPIRFKRGHILFMSLLLTIPLMTFWEFTYSDFFGENAVLFIVGFSFAMNFIDGALSKAVREELLLVPLSGAVNVVLFIGTLGANDFTDFCEGFFIELLLGIGERLVLGTIIERVNKAVSAFVFWVRTRSWFWNFIMLGGAPKRLMLPAEPEVEEGEEEEEVEDEEQEGSPIEEAMDEIIGCGTTCMSTIQAPILIYVIIVFGQETQIPNSYGIKQSDLLKYLLFGLVICPFQVMMDILMNHAVEMKDGVKIYDYMLYARQRWHNRLYRWLFDDPAMDRSIAEPLQSVNHLAFSPQFYFIETYYSWGMLMVLVAMTILLRWQMNPFDDPALGFFCVQQVVCNVFLDKIITVIISQLLWKPKENSLYRAFTRSVEHSLKRREYLDQQEKFRRWFFSKHTLFTINKIGEIFTPRARSGYKMKLNQLYQTALALQPTHSYKVAPEAFPPPLARDELPDDLREELEGTDSSDSEERNAILDQDHPALHMPGLVAGEEDIGVVMQRRGRRGAGAAQMLGNGNAPALPSTAPPPEENWLELLTTPDEESMLELGGQGFGPLAGLITTAWLQSARRHVTMSELAEAWAEELEQLDMCQVCNRQEDALILQGLSEEKGLSLKVTVVSDVPKLVAEFERVYSVPEFPFEEGAWRAFLERNDSWLTLCARCRNARSGAAQASSTGALRPPMPAPALSDSSPGEQDTPSEESEEEDLKPGEVPPEWFDVNVDQTSRELVLVWASMAKRRVKRRQEWEDYRLAEEEEGRETRPINDALRTEAAHLEAGDHSDEELIESSRSSSYSSSQSGSGSGSQSKSGSGSSGSRSKSGSDEYWDGR